MKILLLGEYSNVHWTLAEGLRQLGHEVTVVSDGDSWKGYRRDVDLCRRSTGVGDTLAYFLRCVRLLPRLRGYDVVQFINPMFLELRAKHIYPFYRYLKRHNRRLFLGAFGMDYYWVSTCLDCRTFRYSDFNIGDRPRTSEPFNQAYIRDWVEGEKRGLNVLMAQEADGIVTGLYEYDCCYRPHFPEKTRFIPFPINLDHVEVKSARQSGAPVRFFLGISKDRSAYKGTDVMARALARVKAAHPGMCEVRQVEGVPFDEYRRLMLSSDVLLDQLYSYTPAMNALQAMAQGLVVVGGGEPENYEILGERELRPIVNVLPDEDDVFRQLENIVLRPDRLDILSEQSREYVRRHHDHVAVARRYIDFWTA